MVHDEQAIFVIEPCVKIQKHVRNEHQIHNPVYDLHDEERKKECAFWDGGVPQLWVTIDDWGCIAYFYLNIKARNAQKFREMGWGK